MAARPLPNRQWWAALGSQFIKWAIVGAAASVAQLVTIYLLTERANLYYMASATIAVLVAGIINFTGNRFWSFRSKL